MRAVTPIRDDRGRMYTDADVDRLRLLHRRWSNTDTASAASRRSPTRNCTVWPPRAGASAAPPVAARPADGSSMRPRSPPRCRATTRRPSTSEISRLAAVLRPLELLHDVLMPMLAQVGDEWHRQPASIAQEHLMSSTVRNILGSFLRRVRATQRCRRGCSLRPPQANATKSARLARRCLRPAAASASPISVPIFPRANLSRV